MIETGNFTQEQIANMHFFNRTLGEIKELTDMGDGAQELKRIAFDRYFGATRELQPNGEYVVNNTLVQVAHEIMVEKGVNGNT